MNQRVQDKIDKKWETIRTNPEKYQDAFGSSQEQDGKIAGFETDFLISFNIGFA